jgi:hypothetical protein
VIEDLTSAKQSILMGFKDPSMIELEPVWLGVCGSVFIETVAIYCLVTKRAATFMYGSHL